MDRDLLHLMRDAKAAVGRAISESDLLALPYVVSKPKAVLWDSLDPALLYVFVAESDKAGQLVVRVNYTERVRTPAEKRISDSRNRVTTAGLAQIPDLKVGRYQLVEGKL